MDWSRAAAGFDGGDPLFNFKVPASARYRLRLHEPTAAGSPEHFYRVTIGELPVVAGIYPLGITARRESEVELIGFNLPSKCAVKVKPDLAGEMEVPMDPEKFRSRNKFKVLVSESEEWVETEPNDSPGQATKIHAPGAVNGRIWAAKRPAGRRGFVSV